MKKLILFFLLGSLLGKPLIALEESPADSLVLTYEAYLDKILKYHPVARRAQLQDELAKAEQLSARGFLDPVISSNWDQKLFDEKLYYRQVRGEINVPTPLGIDVVGGYENTAGIFLNPENTTDPHGLWNLGLEVNLLQGFWINERRIALEQAKLFQNRAENQKNLILNDLLYQASMAYLDWQKYTAFREVIETNIQLARQYAENTKQSFLGGEKTAIDTLEANIVLQDAQTLWQSNEAALLKSRQNLENYLWQEESPVLLRPAVLPQDYADPVFESNVLSNNRIGFKEYSC